MKKFEVWFKDGRTEVIEGEDKIQDMILSLENFDREDVDYIYELDDEGEHKKEIWNDWEGIIRDVDDDLAFDDYKDWDVRKDLTLDDFKKLTLEVQKNGDLDSDLTSEDLDEIAEESYKMYVDGDKERPSDLVIITGYDWGKEYDPFDTDWDMV